MIEEEPQQQSQDIIEPKADAKSEESSSENVNLIEAIPEIHESPCEQESVPKQRSKDEASEGIREDDKVKQDEKEEADLQVNKPEKRRIIRKEVRKQCLGKKPTIQHVGTRRKSKLRKREGLIRDYRDRDSIVKLYENGVSSKEIHKAFGVQPRILNKWKNHACQKEKRMFRMKHGRELEKFFKIRQNALDLYRQGIAIKQIASKM